MRLNVRLEGDDPVGGGDECCDVRWSRPRPIQCGEVVVGRPPGNCTTLSNVYRDRSLNCLRDQVAQGWHPEPFDAVANSGTYGTCRVTHKDDPGGLVRFDGSVHSEVPRNRRSGRIRWPA